jgi:hypothetical protein
MESDNQNLQNDSDNGGSSKPSSPQQPKSQQVVSKKVVMSENVRIIRRVCGGVTIAATSLFAFIALFGVWFEIGGEVIWRSFASLAIVGVASLIVAAAAPLLDRNN